ncbi:hypothetical protein L861_13985 [Litchfieldella anticariensis FP35 = DSM 16096]|uniref:Solute-binding protein family 3/N-terminal domain-containing protein n=1 Tax=Litchfieldella anticariensis (strain DSM 16096 / CECT 5854 / CIP 108499 / LMG 22089 / FP35) TaxID=1121939 RepID=S2KYD7_LITA3|nr:ABC transporter substrate-binding protein [Halomonas anticariensis]EPC00379.1 hypothetical protein L861_13985 [Halomonas anticariensis FP35 = DSM 16096]
MTPELKAVRELLTPYGKLRAAINLGNPVLAQRSTKGELGGVSVALARFLAEQLNVTLELVPFDAAGKVVAALDDNAWDVAFLAQDPKRAETICFTAPYVIIEGTYLVPQESSFFHVDDMDQPGRRIAVGQGAAYDLFLTRTLRHAQLVRAPTSAAAVDWFVEQGLDAAAGVRQPLMRFAEATPDYRVLPDSFTQIRQAMALPRQRQEASGAVDAFLKECRETGFVANALAESGQADANIAPSGRSYPASWWAHD